MKTDQYVSQFGLNEKDKEFDRKALLEELNNDFLGLVEKSKEEASNSQEGFTFNKFKQVVKQTEEKFWSISNKKVGLPFTVKYWSAFFAVYVVPARARLFPEIEAEIKEKRDKYIKENGPKVEEIKAKS